MNKRNLSLLLICFLVISMMSGCQKPVVEAVEEIPVEAVEEIVTEEKQDLILATTTSTENSGLLAYILPSFEEKSGRTIKVVAVGTGKALQMGMDGEADVLLVHAKSSEEKFVAEGHGTERFDIMYNDFVLIGPADDPAGLLENANDNVVEALKLVQDSGATFVSRGDDSGTHKKEKQLWLAAELEPAGDWYVEAGKGMGDVIMMANEMQGYTMTDRATYLAMSENIELVVVTENDSILFNQYGVIPVDPNKNHSINEEGATEFVEWLMSEETQELIGEFGVEKFGKPLFTPNAQ